MSLLDPDRYFARLSHISVEDDLVGKGYAHVLLDMDNTILSSSTKSIPRDARTWLARVRDAGIAVCLLSNNWHETPHVVARELQLPVVAKACKPLPHAFIVARDRIGARSATTVVVGDQISTDVLGAHMLGMKAYLVCPLATQEPKHLGFVRAFERSFIGERKPEGAGARISGRMADAHYGLNFNAAEEKHV